MQVLEYIVRTYPDLEFARLQAELRRAQYLELEAKVGTIAETLIAEGEARGKRQGIVEGEARVKPLALSSFSSAGLALCLKGPKLKSWGRTSVSWMPGLMGYLRRKAPMPCSAIFTERSACLSRKRRPSKNHRGCFNVDPNEIF